MCVEKAEVKDHAPLPGSRFLEDGRVHGFVRPSQVGSYTLFSGGPVGGRVRVRVRDRVRVRARARARARVRATAIGLGLVGLGYRAMAIGLGL
jgi:hypothetical protein